MFLQKCISIQISPAKSSSPWRSYPIWRWFFSFLFWFSFLKGTGRAAVHCATSGGIRSRRNVWFPGCPSSAWSGRLLNISRQACGSRYYIFAPFFSKQFSLNDGNSVSDPGRVTISCPECGLGSWGFRIRDPENAHPGSRGPMRHRIPDPQHSMANSRIRKLELSLVNSQKDFPNSFLT